MSKLGQLVGEIQREAAAVPTGELRAYIQASLELLTEYVQQLQGLGPGASLDDINSAANDVLYSALFTALHVQELAERPAPRFARVRLSFN